MINLLPPKEKLQLKSDYRRRQAATATLLAFGFALISLVFLLAINFSIFFQHQSIVALLGSLKNTTRKDQSAAAQTLVKKLNQEFSFFPTTSWGKASDLISGVVAARPRGVTITKWSYGRGTPSTLTILGQADTRDELLAFLDNLKKSDQFTAVNSPISNLIKNRNVPFTLGLTIKESS